jgi:hypothetical protein
MKLRKHTFTLDRVLWWFTFQKEDFSSYDAYYSARMLLMIFYDKRKTTKEFYGFVLDTALEHFEPKDIIILKDFLRGFSSKYRSLLWRLENVSINQ